MKKNFLGRTGLEVTELCFGALPMGPLQKNLSVEECTEIVIAALEKGINFIDTAQGYQVYEPIRRALKRVQNRPIIATKSHAKSYEDMQEAIEEAIISLNVEYIDIFHLHAARDSIEVFETRKGAIQCLIDNKEKGIIKNIGISTHSAAVTKIVSQKNEFDVVFPIINKQGKGIIDGSTIEMKEAVACCVKNGKGVYLMKVLAGGTLVNDYHDAVAFARSIPGYASIAIGMVSVQEIEYNVMYFNAKDVSSIKLPRIKEFKKCFHIVQKVCIGCGECITVCPNNVISISENKAKIQSDECLQCGYCVGTCKQFAIRLV